MTEYKENVWYGWNGDPCPIHLRSEVELIWSDDKGGVSKRGGLAGNMAFEGNEFGKCIAFRVVKEYREPREFWARQRGRGDVISHIIEIEGENMLPPPNWETDPDSRVIRLREVVEGGV